MKLKAILAITLVLTFLNASAADNKTEIATFAGGR